MTSKRMGAQRLYEDRGGCKSGLQYGQCIRADEDDASAEHKEMEHGDEITGSAATGATTKATDMARN